MASKFQAGGRVPAFTFLPMLTCFITAMLIVVLLAAGSRPRVGTTLAFIKVDATNLNIPSKLGGSQYLQDLSKVSGSDLVGQDTTIQTLHIPSTYYITLLGACGHGNGDTVCTARRIGYYFDPRSDLKLDETTVAGTFSARLNDTINTYAQVSGFLGVAYVFAFILTILAPIASFLSSRFGRAGIAGAVISCTATICLIAASIAAVLTFKNLDNAINAELNQIGVTSELGLLVIPSWIAFGFSLLASILLNLKMRHVAPSQGFSSKGPTSGIITGDPRAVNPKVNVNGPRPLTLLKRVQTWGQHKYTQIGVPPVARGRGRGGGGGGEFDDDTALIAHHDSPELGPKRVNESSSIAMKPLDHKGNQDMNLAYEPFTGRAM